MLNGRWGAAAAALLLGFAALPAKPTCACSTRAMAYRSSVKSNLRNLVTAQVTFHTQFHHYSADLAELARSAGFEPSPGVAVEIERGDERGFAARGRHDRWNGDCEIGVGPGAPVGHEGEPICRGAVYDHTASAVTAGLMLLVVMGATVFAGALAWRGRAHWGPLVPLGLLLVLHPSWSLLWSAAKGQIPGSGDCGASLQMRALFFGLMAGALWWWLRRRSRFLSASASP